MGVAWMTPISKSAAFGGKRHFSSSRATSGLDKAVSPALWRQPRTSQLYMGQSLASTERSAFFLRVGASLPSLAGGEWLSVAPERRNVESGSTPWERAQKSRSRLAARLQIAMISPGTLPSNGL